MLSTEEEQNTTLERTFAVIKTDSGTIHEWIEKQGFDIINSKLTCLQHEQWESFKSQEVYVFILEKTNAVKEWNDAIYSNDSDLISKENAYGSPTIEQAQRDISFVFNDQTTDLPQNSDDSETKDAPVLESNEKESDNKMSETEESNKLDEKEINDTANTKQHENDQPKETTEETDIGSISDGNQSVLEKPVQEVQKEQEEKIVEKEEEEKAVKKEEGEKIVEREELINGQLPKEETSAEKVCDNDKTALSKDGKEDASHKENTFTRVNNMVAENPTEHHAHKENGHEVKRDRSNELRDDAVKPSCSRLRQPAMRRGNSLIHSERELTRNGSAKLPKGITRIARLNASPVKKVVKKLVKKEPEEKPKKKKMAPDFISRLTAPTVASKSKKAAGIPKKVDMSKKRPKAIVKSKKLDDAGGLVSSGPESNGHAEIKTN